MKKKSFLIDNPRFLNEAFSDTEGQDQTPHAK